MKNEGAVLPMKTDVAKIVEFVIDREALSFYDEAAGVWVAEEGEFEALVCAASDDVRARVSFCFE